VFVSLTSCGAAKRDGTGREGKGSEGGGGSRILGRKQDPDDLAEELTNST
jgi:hypothetical protein